MLLLVVPSCSKQRLAMAPHAAMRCGAEQVPGATCPHWKLPGSCGPVAALLKQTINHLRQQQCVVLLLVWCFQPTHANHTSNTSRMHASKTAGRQHDHKP
jgi:hypothetical protein